MYKKTANELHLKILAYYQDFTGFQKWWDSLETYEQSIIENGAMLGIERHLSAHAVDCAGSRRRKVN